MHVFARTYAKPHRDELKLLFRKSLLRARGGISVAGFIHYRTNFSSPRTRRYFQSCHHLQCPQQLFSAHAEVFPVCCGRLAPCGPLLRARGGISNRLRRARNGRHSSPRTRRYFPYDDSGYKATQLFSAHAEVFPPPIPGAGAGSSLLRARGGISVPLVSTPFLLSSSPRTRRYFHFSVI